MVSMSPPKSSCWIWRNHRISIWRSSSMISRPDQIRNSFPMNRKLGRIKLRISDLGAICFFFPLGIQAGAGWTIVVVKVGRSCCFVRFGLSFPKIPCGLVGLFSSCWVFLSLREAFYTKVGSLVFSFFHVEWVLLSSYLFLFCVFPFSKLAFHIFLSLD